MNMSDRLFLLGLAERYGTGLDMSAMFEAIPHVRERDLAGISGVLGRLSPEAIARVIRSPLLHLAIGAFIRSRQGPRRRVGAFLKLGVRVDGLVLPAPIRDALPIDARVEDGQLLLDGEPVDLIGITLEQNLDLRAIARRVAAADFLAGYPSRP